MQKKALEIAERMKTTPGLGHLDESERLLIARSLAATPDERWRMNRKYVRLVGSSQPLPQKKSGSRQQG